MTVLTKISLPNGTAWSFEYAPNSFAQLTKVHLPTGGYIRYTYQVQPNFFFDNLLGGAEGALVVTGRFESPDGVSENPGSSYSYATTLNANPPQRIVTQVSPMGDTTIATFKQVLGYEQYLDTDIEFRQGSSQTLEKIHKDYACDNIPLSVTAVAGDLQNPGFVAIDTGTGNCRVTDVTTTLYDSASLPTKKVHYEYDASLTDTYPDVAYTGPSGTLHYTTYTTTFGNVTKILEYDWGSNGQPGPLLRETDRTYLIVNAANGNIDYTQPHIVNRLAQEVIKDGRGNIIAQTKYEYDGSALATTSGVPQHDYNGFPSANRTRGNRTKTSRWRNTDGTWLDTVNTYNDLGNLLSQTDPLGNPVSYDYTDDYSDGINRTTQAYLTKTTYPKTGAVAHVERRRYYYNTGLVYQFIDQNSQATTFGYDNMNRLSSSVFPDQGETDICYSDTSGASCNNGGIPLNVVTTKKITSSLNLVTTAVIDGLGRTSQTQLNSDPLGTAFTDITYDADGRKATESNPHRAAIAATDGITTYQYDALSRVTQVAPPDGSVPTAGSSCLANNTCTQYSGNATTVTDQTGNQRRSISDGLGRLTEVHEPNPNAPPTPATGTLNVNGTLLYQNNVGQYGANPGTGSVTVSGKEQCISDPPPTCKPPMICCLVMPEPDWSYLDPPAELALQTICDSGTVSITVNGHPDKVSYGSGTPSSIASALAAAINGDGGAFVTASASSATVYLTSKASGSGTNYSLSSSYTYDTADFSSPSFTTANSGGTLTGGYDAYPGVTVYDKGTVTLTVNGFNAQACYGRSTDCAAPPSGCPTGDSTASQVACVLAAALNASGSPVTATSSGTTITMTDKTPGATGDGVAVTFSPQSTQTQWTFSPPSFNATNAVLGGGLNTGDVANNPYITLYQYDGLSNLLRVDQKGSAPTDSTKWRTRLFTYDSLSRLLTAQNPESGTISYSYDADGNLLQKTSPQANQTGSATTTISYCYDPLNRITAKAYTNSPLVPPQCAQTLPYLPNAAASYTYDSGANNIGHLTSLTDQAGSGSYAYDVMGRMKTESRTIAGQSKSMSYAYNLDGSVKTLTYPSNAVVTYTPDAAGRMLSAVDKGHAINYVTGATYAPDGSPTGFVSGGTVTNSFSYNKRLQPINMSASTSSQMVFSIGYDFHLGAGDNGNVFGITNYKDNTRNQSFTYDFLNRLTSAQNAGTDCGVIILQNKTKFWGNGYTYDAWGNLTDKGDLPGATGPKCVPESLHVTADAQNRAHMPVGADYQYDAAGNMTYDAKAAQYYSYDQENRISGANTSLGTETYTYDADGNRVEKSTGGSSPTGTLYWYMSPGIVGESDLSGNLTAEYVFFDGERVARRDSPGGNPSPVFYYFSDHLKTTDVVTDAQGNIENESDFYPWGGELQFLANDSNHYKFTGKGRDSESGLDYFGARYYSNGLGRWVTPDWAAKPAAVPYAVLGDPQSLNLYTYVRNIPTTRFDMDGHDGCGFWCKLGNELTYGVWGDEKAVAAAEAKKRAELKKTQQQWVAMGHSPQLLTLHGNQLHGPDNLTTNVDQMDRAAVFRTSSDIKLWITVAAAGIAATTYYQSNPKHGETPLGDVSADAKAGGTLFRNSILVNANSSVAVDAQRGVFVVYRWDNNGQMHGYEVGWDGLRANQRSVLHEAGMVNQKGEIINALPPWRRVAEEDED